MIEKWLINVLSSGSARKCIVSCEDIVFICGAKVIDGTLYYLDTEGRKWLDANPTWNKKGDK